MCPTDVHNVSELPWATDRELTVAQTGRAIRSQFPDIRANSVRLIGSGWDNDAFVVDDRWVFRFPRRRDMDEQLEKDRKLAPIVAQALSGLGVAVPAMTMLGEPCDDFPYRFGGYRLLPGVPADEIPEGQADPALVGEGLGAVLTRLHSLDADGLANVDLAIETNSPADSLAEVREVADALLRRENAEIRRHVQWVLGSANAPSPYAGEPRFIHNDIASEHLLVDPQSGRLIGLLDFSDSAFGDPAQDFASLPSQLGWEATEAALDAYSLPIDHGFRERLEFLSRAYPIIWLNDVHLSGGDLEKHRRWVLEAFASRTQPLKIEEE